MNPNLNFTGRFLNLSLMLLFCLTHGLSLAQVPDPDLSYVTVANNQPVSIMSLPNGGGDSELEARLFDDGTTDGTITLTLLDGNANPVVGYPVNQMRLCFATSDCGPVCTDGNIADQPTDSNGQTTFTRPLSAGGHGGGREARIVVGTPPNDFEVFLTIGDCVDCHYFNSPDINGDLIVNLIDVQLFAHDFYGERDYRSDFFWDAVLNLNDIAILAAGFGAACP